jgi:hypothetical protein
MATLRWPWLLIAAKIADDHLQPTLSSSRLYEFRSRNEKYRSAGFIFAACKQELSFAASNVPVLHKLFAGYVDGAFDAVCALHEKAFFR